MKRRLIAVCLILLIALGLISCNKEEKKVDEKVVAAYIMLDEINKKDFDMEEFATKQFKDGEVTHLFISFGHVGKDFNLVFKNDLKDVKNAIKKLKSYYKKTKICLSIGGAQIKTDEENKNYEKDNFYNFSKMAKTEESRKVFVDSVVKFVDENNIDGIDMNWEFPVQGGWGSIDAAPDDKVNFTYLMRSLREELDSLKKETKKEYSLSFANSPQKFVLESFELEEVLKIVDFMNLMTYDFAGNWSNRTMLNSPLSKSDTFRNEGNNVEDTLKMYKSWDLEAYFNKIVIGIPSYAYGWTSVGTSNNGKNQIAKDTIKVKNNPLPYKDVNEKTLKVSYFKDDNKTIKVDIDGLERGYDKEAKAYYLFKPDGSVFITYEDPEAIMEKGKYVKSMGLGGMMMWQATFDDGTLIKAMADSLKE